MTGRAAFMKALIMLQYDNGIEAVDDGILKQMNAVINSVYVELFRFVRQRGMIEDTEYAPIEDMDKAIALPDEIMNDCFVYGVAMWIAQGQNDSNNQRFFAGLYEYKRNRLSCYSESAAVEDVLP